MNFLSLELDPLLLQAIVVAMLGVASSANDRIEGSTDPFGSFEDRYDILEGGAGVWNASMARGRWIESGR